MFNLLIQIPAGACRALRETARRTWHYGWRAGWTCLRAHAVNGAIRVRNALCRNPNVTCPCCGWEGYSFRTLDIGHWLLPQIECPNCLAHDRHRMLELFFSRRPPDFLKQAGVRVLHFAPEPHVLRYFQEGTGPWLLAGDLDPRAMIHARGPRLACDMQQIPLRESAVDGILCIHVLEHIPDDRQALRELARILKPGGMACIMAPLSPIPATRDWGAPDPLLFQHYRDYSASDFAERLQAFEVEAVRPADLMSPDEQQRFQIPDLQVVYCCRIKETV